MSTYFAVQIIHSLNPIQEYEIENKIELWKRRHSNAYITKTKTETHESKRYNYALLLTITYQANSRVAMSPASKTDEKHLINFPKNYNNAKTNNQDGSKGIGHAAREHGKFGSYPEHDDYSEES